VKNLENDMARIESSILVGPSPEEVFAFLNSPESHARFIPNMAIFQQTSPGAFGKVGATARGWLSYFGLIKIRVQYEIIEHESNRQLAMQGQMGPFLFKDGYVLSKNGGGTEIKFWLDLLPTGWAKLLTPFMGLIGRIHAWETLRNLKRELEAEQLATAGRAPSSQ
jgi:carbon monoxide dehydrogenase subunit G